MAESTRIQCDVLVVGGGMAGLAAAVAAAEEGTDVVLASLGEAGKSGATYYDVAEIGAFNAPCACETDSAQVFYEDIMTAALSMASPKLCRILAEEAEPALHRLAAMPGGETLFEREQNRYKVFQACFSSKPRSHIIHDHFRPLLQVLGRQAVRLGVRCVPCMVSELLVEDNRCFGALGLDARENEMTILAGAVVLAAGGASQLFSRNMYPWDVTGSGYALASMAGAKMTNMEFIQMGIGVAHPFINLFEHYLWDCMPVLKNAEGKAFLEDYLPEGVDRNMAIADKGRHFPFSTRDHSKYVEIAVQNEINCGRGTSRGNVFLDVRTDRQQELLKQGSHFSSMWPTTWNWYHSKGVDLLKQPIEVACFAHAINGGALINESAETSVQNLFAVGEAASGPHGADRLGGNMSLTSQVFGQIAGKESAARARKERLSPDKQKAERYRRQAGSYGLEAAQQGQEMLAHLQRMTDRSMLIVRNEDGLARYRDELDSLVAEMESRPKTLTRQAVGMRHLLEAGSLMAQAALARKESRGSHYREDYPVMKSQYEQNYVIERRAGSFQKV